jgi:hypothetical protein
MPCFEATKTLLRDSFSLLEGLTAEEEARAPHSKSNEVKTVFRA